MGSAGFKDTRTKTSRFLNTPAHTLLPIRDRWDVKDSRDKRDYRRSHGRQTAWALAEV